MWLSPWLPACVMLIAGASPAEPDRRGVTIPPAEYAIYDRIIASKYLTSQTELVLIQQETVVTIDPPDPEHPAPPLTASAFAERGLFENRLPGALIADFVLKSQKPARLDRRFGFGVSYRLVGPDVGESPEVSVPSEPTRRNADRPTHALISGHVSFPSCQLVNRGGTSPAFRVQRSALTTIGVLAFSRAGLAGSDALVYVAEYRRDGTGAGILFWLRRAGGEWTFWDSEVLWRVGEDAASEDAPAGGEP